MDLLDLCCAPLIAAPRGSPPPPYSAKPPQTYTPLPPPSLKSAAFDAKSTPTTAAPLNTLLVVGASSGVGMHIVDQALSIPFFTRTSVLSRGENPAEYEESRARKRAVREGFERRGATCYAFDYIHADFEQVVEIMKGHKVVVLMTSTATDDEGWKESTRLIDCAKAARVTRLIPNVFGVDYNLNPEYPWLWPRQLIHEHLEASGLEWCEFMNGWYGQFFISSEFCETDFDAWTANLVMPETTIVILFPIMIAKCFTYRKDVAKYVLASLQHRAAETHNRHLRIFANRASPAEMVRRMEAALPSRGPVTVTTLRGDKIYDIYTPEAERPVDGVEINPFLRMASRGTATFSDKESDNGLFIGLVKPQSVWDALDEKVRKYLENNM
ncbi:hypothetical protein BDK51DRAFT_51131 [Blyttiomyces helicus]|uniref:NmrA-like domain-containing protein n=1 Tax=Blyttiomyces helicus TaxID=388810 RepID=A0A4P9VYF6_9FUNG|nr:hypothetical protein BDK51DRAFT_51131 [Blyttiomyces helicus]|eukprot:RKO82816.1 hypothetical protein BDK51DRAFT_51131 [Blyttiomyces helicus]